MKTKQVILEEHLRHLVLALSDCILFHSFLYLSLFSFQFIDQLVRRIVWRAQSQAKATGLLIQTGTEHNRNPLEYFRSEYVEPVCLNHMDYSHLKTFTTSLLDINVKVLTEMESNTSLVAGTTPRSRTPTPKMF